MLMSSPKMVMLALGTLKSESHTRNEAEAFQLHTSNVGWLDHARWPNKTRRAFYSFDP